MAGLLLEYSRARGDRTCSSGIVVSGVCHVRHAQYPDQTTLAVLILHYPGGKRSFVGCDALKEKGEDLNNPDHPAYQRAHRMLVKVAQTLPQNQWGPVQRDPTRAALIELPKDFYKNVNGPVLANVTRVPMAPDVAATFR